MKMASSHSKDHMGDIHKEHIQIFKKIDSFLQDLSVKLKKQVEVIETTKLQQYKDDLIKTKGEFEQMNQKRSDNAIKNTVFNQKKALQKECAGFLEKSMEVSKLYEGLKSKLITMESTQQQLQHQIQYLHKQIRNASTKKQYLGKELKSFQQWQTNDKLQKKKKKNQISILGENINNEQSDQMNKTTKNGKQISQMLNKTRKWQQSSQQRLRDKTENTKYFLDSLFFDQSTLEQIFQAYNPQQYKEDKKKLSLIQNVFSQEHVKKQLYYLIFENSRI